MRSFLLLLFLPSGAACSGPQRSRARRFLARRKRTLDGEDRCESMGAGGKDLVLKDVRTQDFCKTTEEQG